MSSGSFRTYSWIARQPYNVRYLLTQGRVETDDSKNSQNYVSTYPKLKDPVPECFKKGSLWPSLVLIEKHSADLNSEIIVYARIFKREEELVIDLEVGQDIDEAHAFATKFKIPLYRKTWTKTGKLTGVRRLDTLPS
ncbi:MAG: hypothetical protein ACXACI_01715 [Candidatus Hodarchaeales archaeon]|jgi:hypothetical protein